ncbi:RHS repeat domain-containing protein [Paenibacillus aceti]|uniref:Teneurin-like YD-shell domain-containing protein n=1 Tax=Paenibacillus aceti TaxID=1820010 RepID=A0ABQ1W6M6_9BACL|nr:RHS repeat-associated core domain-containing protein [Paenibacillus aceti]GGG17660.1 hypothetical protein GCM10010913_44710 [Paenibacillus aceti]
MKILVKLLVVAMLITSINPGSLVFAASSEFSQQNNTSDSSSSVSKSANEIVPEAFTYKSSESKNFSLDFHKTDSTLKTTGRNQYIQKNFSPKLKQILAYYQPEELVNLTEEQKLEVVNWSEEQVIAIIEHLSEREKEHLNKIVPAAIENYNYVRNREGYLQEYQSDLEENKTITQLMTTPNSLSNINSAKPFQVDEFNSEYNYSVQTGNIVDPIYRTANHSVTDIQLTGKYGLGLNLSRSYNSLFSKVLSPEYEINIGNIGKVTSKAEINGFIATGWTLNIPNMQITSEIAEIKPELLSCAAVNNPCAEDPNANIPTSGFLTKYSLQSSEVEKIIFTLENGASIEFHNGVPYQYPYQNVALVKEKSNYKLTVNEEFTYTFSPSGRILSKENRYGDKILYQYNDFKTDGNDNINIIDSYQRNITIFRKRDLNFKDSPLIITGIKVTDETAIVKDIKYDVSRSVTNLAYRTWSDEAGAQIIENPNLGYWQLEQVIDQTQGKKILESYDYYTIDSTKLADFNFKSNDYAYSSNADGTPTPYDANQCTDKTKICYSNQWLWSSDNQYVESSSIVQVNNIQYGEIAYLLLKNINFFNGLKVKFNYQNYNSGWSINPEYVQKELFRGSTRLYTDANAITYFGYHAVERVDYIYEENNQTKLISDYYANQHLDHGWQFNEYWKNHKQNIPRLRNSSRFGHKQTIRTQKQVGKLQNYSFKQYEYEPDGINFVLKYNWVNPEDYNPLELNDQGIHYTNRNSYITSYEYTQGTEQPNVISSYVGNISDVQSPPPPPHSSIKESYTYDEWGLVTKYVDKSGNTTLYQYDGPQHKLTKKIIKSSDQQQEVVQELVYYSSNDPESYKREQLKSTIWTQKYRDPVNPSKMNSDTYKTEYTLYDKDRNVLQTLESAAGDQFEKVPQVTERNYTYTALGQVETESIKTKLSSGPYISNLKTEYRYDIRGNIIRILYPDHSFRDYKYDSMDRIVFSSFTLTRRDTSISYDDAKRQVTITLPDGEIQRTEYSPFGLALRGEQSREGMSRVTFVNQTTDGQIIDAELPFGEPSLQTSYTYDSIGRQKTRTDSMGNTTVFTYANTAIGNNERYQETVEMNYPDGKVETKYYNTIGLLERIVEKSSDQVRTTSKSYSAFGDVTKDQIITQIGGSPGSSNTTEYSYDSNHHLILLKDQEGKQHKYAYDHNGNLLTYYLNGKKQTENSYNEAGWIMSSTDASSNKESYEYNNIGLTAKFMDKKGQVTRYAYTNLNELESVEITNSNRKVYGITYAYDKLTRKITNLTSTEYGEQNKVESIDYHYDQWNRIDQQTVAGRNYQLGYDNWDRLINLSFPDAKTQQISYDNLSRIESVEYGNSGIMRYNYSIGLNNNFYTISYPNRTSQRIQQNEFGEIIGLTHQTNGVATFEELNKYDGLGNIVEINRTRGNQSSNERFSYDSLNRLVQEEIEPGQIKYVYDEQGNRQQRSTTFDEEQPSTKQTHYSYNAANMLNGFSDKEEGTEYSYTYYADGLRATKMGTNERVRYVYLNGNVIEELNLDSDGNVTGVKARNIWGNELLYREDNNSNKAGYYLYNGHGDVIQINDSAGTMLNSYEYDTWGKITSMVESMSNPYRYTGQYYDDESGLYYLRARYYDPVDGRFVSEDTYKGTLTNPLTLNLYTYVQNNPLRYIDPSGNVAIDPLLWDYNYRINEQKINWAEANEREDSAAKKAASNEADRLRKEFYNKTTNKKALRDGLLQSTETFLNRFNVTNKDNDKITTILVDKNGTVYYGANPMYDYWEQIHTFSKTEQYHAIAAKAIIGYGVGTVATFGTTQVVMHSTGAAASLGLEFIPGGPKAGATKSMIYRTNKDTGKIDNMIIDTEGYYVTNARYWKRYK